MSIALLTPLRGRGVGGASVLSQNETKRRALRFVRRFCIETSYFHYGTADVLDSVAGLTLAKT